VRAAEWLDRGDPEARWSAGFAEDGSVWVQRLWRGVTDHHVIEAAFLTSAEARKLARVAGERAEVYRGIARLVKAGAAEEVSEAEPAGEDEDGGEVAARPTVIGGAITRPSQLLEAVLA